MTARGRIRVWAARPVAPTMALTLQRALWFELMPFYSRQAWLLDERKLKEWLDLFADDVLYFMPRRKDVSHREAHRELTPLGDLAILEEDKRYLEVRVARLDTGMAWAEGPPVAHPSPDRQSRGGAGDRSDAGQVSGLVGIHALCLDGCNQRRGPAGQPVIVGGSGSENPSISAA
jgi:Ring hydroxylating beta subunit